MSSFHFHPPATSYQAKPPIDLGSGWELRFLGGSRGNLAVGRLCRGQLKVWVLGRLPDEQHWLLEAFYQGGGQN